MFLFPRHNRTAYLVYVCHFNYINDVIDINGMNDMSIVTFKHIM